MTSELESESPTFSVQIEEDCAVVTLKDGAFVLGTDLGEKERFLGAISDIEAAEHILAIVCFNAPQALDDVAHQNFIERLFPKDGGKARSSHVAAAELLREANAFNQFLLWTTESSKLVISCLRGTVATPFFGLSLAADLRLVSPDMSFSLSHVTHGVPPTGALAFLLPRFVGQGQATQMLLGGGMIGADRALELGLVSQIVTDDDFHAACLRVVTDLAHRSSATVPFSRPLLYPYADELRGFLAKESKLRSQAFHRPR